MPRGLAARNDGTMDATTAMNAGVAPLKRFMLDQTRESDIATFVRISNAGLRETCVSDG